MADFKYQLVLQIPGTTAQDFKMVLELEESLIEALSDTPHRVDGYDFGSGNANIFIDTNDPFDAFALAKEIVSHAGNLKLKAAFRAFQEEHYSLIWPENSLEEFNLI